MLEEWYFELMKLKKQGLTEGAKKGYDTNDLQSVLNHFKEEWQEFIEAYESGGLKRTLKELADLSNMCDLLFEELWDLKKGRR